MFQASVQALHVLRIEPQFLHFHEGGIVVTRLCNQAHPERVNHILEFLVGILARFVQVHSDRKRIAVHREDVAHQGMRFANKARLESRQPRELQFKHSLAASP